MTARRPFGHLMPVMNLAVALLACRASVAPSPEPERSRALLEPAAAGSPTGLIYGLVGQTGDDGHDRKR
jgi:hypothetical protein